MKKVEREESRVEGRTLREEVMKLVARFGRAAVRTAVDAIDRRASTLTDNEHRRLAELRRALSFYPERAFHFYRFLQAQKRAGVPVKVSIEILERVVAVKPLEPWALVSTIMVQDYPGFPWGTSRGGPRRVESRESSVDG